MSSPYNHSLVMNNTTSSSSSELTAEFKPSTSVERPIQPQQLPTSADYNTTDLTARHNHYNNTSFNRKLTARHSSPVKFGQTFDNNQTSIILPQKTRMNVKKTDYLTIDGLPYPLEIVFPKKISVKGKEREMLRQQQQQQQMEQAQQDSKQKEQPPWNSEMNRSSCLYSPMAINSIPVKSMYPPMAEKPNFAFFGDVAVAEKKPQPVMQTVVNEVDSESDCSPGTDTPSPTSTPADKSEEPGSGGKGNFEIGDVKATEKDEPSPDSIVVEDGKADSDGIHSRGDDGSKNNSITRVVKIGSRQSSNSFSTGSIFFKDPPFFNKAGGGDQRSRSRASSCNFTFRKDV